MNHTAVPIATAPRPADISDYVAIHAMIRRATRALATATVAVDRVHAARGRALHRWWKGYVGELQTHHVVEDTIFFPTLVERVPAAERHLERVDGDHAELDRLIADGDVVFAGLRAGGPTGAAAGVVARLDRLMTAHLDFEDEDLVPLFARHFEQDEYAALHQRALKSLGINRQVLFTVPYAGTWMTPSEWRQLFATAPLPLKAIWFATRRNHARLTREALGSAAEQVA